jgi:hypothetical protein
VQILEEKNIISTPEDKLASTVVENMKETIKKAKHRRSDEARATVSSLNASHLVLRLVYMYGALSECNIFFLYVVALDILF